MGGEIALKSFVLNRDCPFADLRMADAAIQTSFDACDNRDNKLKDALMSLINITNENETRLKALRSEHDTLRQDNDSHGAKMADENEKRKTEFSALKGKQESENQARVTDLAKSDGKVDTEFKNRKEEVVQINSWYDGENETRKVEIADLGKVLNKENEARKEAIDKLEAFVKSASVSAVGDLDARINAEASAREAEDKALSDRIASQVVAVREEKMAALNTKADGQIMTELLILTTSGSNMLSTLLTWRFWLGKLWASISVPTEMELTVEVVRTLPSMVPIAMLAVVLT